MKSIIVAYDKSRGIGASNDLLWIRDLPADLRHFKEVTTGSSIIMGRKTYESIGRPLPDRQNIVVSHESLSVKGFTFVKSLEDAYAATTNDNVFVIGGGQIYAQAISGVETLYVTEVDEIFQAEVFFPEIDSEVWVESTRVHHGRDKQNKYDYDFVTYVRR